MSHPVTPFLYGHANVKWNSKISINSRYILSRPSMAIFQKSHGITKWVPIRQHLALGHFDKKDLFIVHLFSDVKILFWVIKAECVQIVINVPRTSYCFIWIYYFGICSLKIWTESLWYGLFMLITLYIYQKC